ncbi:chromate transporter [Anaerofustis stercorihominis]|uniref:Chromate transport protein n=2 Tax=Anaerofustis stercorihominis TaxID=214853 RepID=B1C8D5_9FIRM|nr:chromate transporter [Anaerofustis stercorihominis]EDS73272.1 chromate transport protein [Anaerofustis stercorihominis DSM 17244]MCQ4794564.1 chromate transporter [Anaerofustis stercorihominis]RGD74127.1 chromate transporter [Anaerofustis stercorihominis]
MKNKDLDLFITFANIGAFTFGGGYAMIPLLQKEVVEKKKWIDENEMLDITAISQSTPGPLAINCATFVGYKIGGVWGSVLATLGVVVPSFFIIIGVSIIFNMFKDNIIVNNVFAGVKAGVIVLILEAALKLGKPIKKDYFNMILLFASLLITAFTSINVIYVLIACALLGVIFHGFNIIKGGDM